MRRQLLGLQQAGKIDVEEEFEQACFHITVYKSYVPPVPSAQEPDSPRRAQAPPGTRQGSRPLQKPASQLPADLAVGEFPAQGR